MRDFADNVDDESEDSGFGIYNDEDFLAIN